MADDLLSYYNQELLYLTRLGAEFAELHPGAAGRLRMSADAVEDPHVSRLLQGVAFLNARIRRKLDDEFPELTTAILEQLYPQYLAPIPSMAIFSFAPERDLGEPRIVPAFTEVNTEAPGGEICTYRTTQDTKVWPIEIQSAALTGRPLRGPASPRGCVSTLRVSLRCTAPDMTFKQLGPDTLRFYLRGALPDSMRLYELLFNNAPVIAVADSANDPHPLLLDQSAIRPVGFGADEGTLPYNPSSPLGYRLLLEFFAFPQKYLFFDISGLAEKFRASGGRTVELYFYLNQSSDDLENGVTGDSFALGCAAAINLFRQRAEAMLLTETTVEYQIVPDSRRPGALEIYSIDQVTVTERTGAIRKYVPFFGLTHASAAGRAIGFWHAARRPAGGRDQGTETFISLVDLNGTAAQPADATASIETTCLNRDLPAKLPFGAGRPHLRLAQAVPGIASVTCLTAPTATLRLPGRKEIAWRLISHLNLNQLSLIDSHGGAEALREILRLYDFRDAPETQAMIDSVLSVKAKRGTARAPEAAMGALCRGLDITIEFDEHRSSGGGVFLFAAVLERFVAHYASINAFTRMTATVQGRAGILRTWLPRAGDLTLL